MKLLFAIFIFTTLLNNAFANPGSHKLACKSAKNSGANQRIELSLKRSNGARWSAPIIEMSIENKKFQLTTPDESNNYGTTFHNSPLKVITVTAEVPFDQKANTGFFGVVAIPETVKAFDNQNNSVKWSLKAEKEDCYDSNGKALFQGVVHGNVNIDNTEINIDAQVLDCELTYNSGMSC